MQRSYNEWNSLSILESFHEAICPQTPAQSPRTENSGQAKDEHGLSSQTDNPELSQDS